jgi:hypothetical protein
VVEDTSMIQFELALWFLTCDKKFYKHILRVLTDNPNEGASKEVEM